MFRLFDLFSRNVFSSPRPLRLRGLFLLSLLLVALPRYAFASAESAPVEIAGSTMGTYYRVKLSRLPQNIAAEQLQAEIDAQLETINNQMSTWRENSELSRFNKQTGTDWFQVSPETALVVAEAIRISELSHGAFDVTVGPLINLWNFGEKQGENRIPSEQELAIAKKKIGYRNLDVRMSPPALRKKMGEIHVNLSAIAKGFAVDRIAEYLDEVGISGYMVDIGGEVRTRGTKPDGSDWSIGIQSPLRMSAAVYKAVSLKNRSMATSGDYRNYFVKDGKRYSHTIDPRTGRPVAHRLASVSVVHKSCMTADALATAIMVLGPEEGYNLAVKEQIPVLLLIYAGDGFVEKATPGFQNLSAKQEGSPATLFLFALGIFAIAILGMSVGVLFSNRRLKGTCGGMSGLKDEQGRVLCDSCSTPSEECEGVGENIKTANRNN